VALTARYILCAVYGYIYSYRMVDKFSNAKRQIKIILLNILPSTIVSKLMLSKSMVVNEFPETTILFADIVGFTAMCKTITPFEQAKNLNILFSDFDSIIEEMGLEKIRSIGDQYVVAAGLPTFREDHAEATVEVAMKMLDAANFHTFTDKKPVTLRIGINTGPVVAGIISEKRVSYDIWGDTVNMASRMESKGLPGRIQVTENTYQKLKNTHRFSKKRVIEAKGSGQIGAYVLEGRL